MFAEEKTEGEKSLRNDSHSHHHQRCLRRAMTNYVLPVILPCMNILDRHVIPTLEREKELF